MLSSTAQAKKANASARSSRINAEKTNKESSSPRPLGMPILCPMMDQAFLEQSSPKPSQGKNNPNLEQLSDFDSSGDSSLLDSSFENPLNQKQSLKSILGDISSSEGEEQNENEIPD